MCHPNNPCLIIVYYKRILSGFLCGAFHFSASEISLVVSASFLTSMITQPIIGAWNDKYDMKKVDSLLFMIASIGGIVFMLADSLAMIVISYSAVLMIINA